MYLAYGFGAPLGGWIAFAFSLSIAFYIAAACAFLSFMLMLTIKAPEKKLIEKNAAEDEAAVSGINR